MVAAARDGAAKKFLMGTGGYLAPEIKRGEEASAASDVYALGVAFFRMLTGIWYEPGTDALRLLEPLEGPWRRVLPPMLEEDPAKRPQNLLEFLREACADAAPPRRPAMPRRIFLAALFCAAAVGVVAPFISRHVKSHSPEMGVDAHMFFDLGEGVCIEMVKCRAADGGEFWIGANHVTNAEWLRVTGNARNGGADTPATGMSIYEVHKFVKEMNRRFAAKVPRGMRFRLPSAAEVVAASTAGGMNAADASVLGVLGPAVADKKAAAARDGIKWEFAMVKLPCRVRTKPPNAWGVYDVVGQGRTICRETEQKNGKTRNLQLGPDDVAERSTVGEWGWNSTLRLALGVE